MIRNLSYVILFVSAVSSIAIGQKNFSFQVTLDWGEEKFEHPLTGEVSVIPNFSNVYFSDLYPSLPVYGKRIKLPANGQVQAFISNDQYAQFERISNEDDLALSSFIKVNAIIEQDRKHWHNNLFCPVQ